MNEVYLAVYGDKVTISESLFISVFSMIVVFFVLLIISYLIDATALLLKKKNNNNNELVVKSETQTLSKNDNGVNVAIIAAAIASYMGSSFDSIKIKKIRKIERSNSQWSFRSILNQINKV